MSKLNLLPARPLGKSGLNVTSIGTGLWAQGGNWGPSDDGQSLSAIDAALDAGVNFFDTSDIYGDGHSETVLGQAMKGRRDRFIVATKIGWKGFDHDRGVSKYDSPDRLFADFEGNLKRLQTDHVDVLQCHVPYPEPNDNVFVDAFRKLQEQGKVRAWGLSSSWMEKIKTFNASGDCAVLQTDYSILNRTAEQEIFPFCLEHQIGVIVRGPLVMGILAGKFTGDETEADFPGDDFRKNWLTDPEQNAQFKADLAAVENLRPLVESDANPSLAQLALRFVIDHPAVSTVIPGARTATQAQSNSAVGQMPPLTAEEYAAIDAIVPPGGGRKIWPA